jgi:arylformamidase
VDWIDVSVPVRTGMVVYEGDPPVRVERVSRMDEGAPADVSRVEMGAHTGTHVDAPAHFLPGGAGVEELPADALIGPAAVVDARGAEGDIDAGAVSALAIPEGTVRILLKTRNEALWERDRFAPGFVGVTEDGARALVQRGARLVGIDYLSIAPAGEPAPTHRVLLEAGVVVLEGLDLRAAAPGAYWLACLPVRLEGADGAPARALLRPIGDGGREMAVMGDTATG